MAIPPKRDAAGAAAAVMLVVLVAAGAVEVAAVVGRADVDETADPNTTTTLSLNLSFKKKIAQLSIQKACPTSE